MGVIAVSRFETVPGHATKHLELHMEALERLRALGLQAVALQPLAGGDTGSLGMTINYADHADWATSTQKVQGDTGWQEFYAKALDSGAARQVESSLYVDVDPSFTPAPDRPLGAVSASLWRPLPGKLEAFMGKVMESKPIMERLGATVRVLQTIVSPEPMSVMYVQSFADLDAYAAHTDAVGTNEEWQTFWADALRDPSGDLLRTGVYVNMTD